MRTLLHLPLSPFCRKVRVAMAEKRLDVELKVEKTWERRPDFLALNPAGTVPVLIETDGYAICHSQAICEHLEETYPERELLGQTPQARAEIRRLIAWFDEKFAREVVDCLYREKLMKRFLGTGEPSSQAIRAGYQNIRYHMEYLGWLAERRRFLAGETFSLADIAAAAHLSTLDYLGDVPWDAYPRAKEWYARIKSRPSFRPLLADHVPGSPPPSHYADLDF
ncbi:MAG: glutathione S-transferase family protein [Azospirillum sp.]|nr:glutathione S-transferase family protein [Azospirillum sp.]MCA3268366.1 glutathione S-transferase family protein [Azospirillum sp.]MCZ8123410.1 glutathione S-transferase family protein [Magnetospirillum sp.]